MRALIVQHEHNGSGGRIAEHLADRWFDVEVLQVMSAGSTHSDVEFPDPTDYDVIVPLGSVHGVYDHDVIGSWVHREIDMLATAHEAEVPVFGICFGAQVIATALGGRVEKSPYSEIGWYHYDTDVPEVIAPGPWFTWHIDRCFLPESVTVLARTELCPQAFRAGRTVGVQFHPEVDRDLVADWVSRCSPEYFAGHGVTADELLGRFDDHGPVAATQATALFDWFLDEVAR
jgi:GMP synthase-like glutamine amidotransferase